MADQNAREGMTMEGIVTVRRHPTGTIARIEKLKSEGRYSESDALVKSGELVTRSKNTIVDSQNCGIDILRQWWASGLTGVNSFPLGPQWGEIGTGTTAPTVSDTALATPVARGYISSATNNGSGSSVSIQFFFSDAILPDNTYTEFGTFVGGSSTIGSGQMANHVLFTTAYTKTTGDDTTCEVDITMTNA